MAGSLGSLRNVVVVVGAWVVVVLRGGLVDRVGAAVVGVVARVAAPAARATVGGAVVGGADVEGVGAAVVELVGASRALHLIDPLGRGGVGRQVVEHEDGQGGHRDGQGEGKAAARDAGRERDLRQLGLHLDQREAGPTLGAEPVHTERGGHRRGGHLLRGDEVQGSVGQRTSGRRYGYP